MPTGARAFAENARPLFLKVPDGVYRELLLERLAEVVGLAPQRLRELWTPGAAAPLTEAPAALPRPRSANTVAGRGSLVRQAIVRLLHYPAIAAEVSPAERAGLDASEEPGVALLRELLDDLRGKPRADRRPGRAALGTTARAGSHCRSCWSARRSSPTPRSRRPNCAGRWAFGGTGGHEAP